MYDLVIIGGGPAGMAAGVYAGRANLSTLIIEKGLPGGQMQNSLEVENYPGHTTVLGPELSEQMHQHTLACGSEWKQGEVTDVDLQEPTKKVLVGGETITARALLIACGAQPRYLQVPGEREFAGRGVSYCATCDAAFFRDKRVLVVGGGDSAIEEGTFLTRFATKVTVVHRRDALRAQPILQSRAFANPKMDFIWDTQVSEILGDHKVTGVKLENKRGEHQVVDVDGVFIYIGFDPNTKFLTKWPILNEAGYVVTNKENMMTALSGVFAAGDIRDTNLRQIVTAASDGAQAAMAIYHYLDEGLGGS